MEPATSRHIAIVGAGPAGLLLAYTLHQNSVPFTIFEARSRAAHLSQQGGSLDLHAKTGLLALKNAGLAEKMMPLTRVTGNGVTLTDKRQRRWFAWPGGASKPEVDRADLIEFLLSVLPGDCVEWSHPVASVENDGYVRFTQGSSIEPVGPFTLVVGCDGAWSRIRQRLSTTTPYPVNVLGQRFTVPRANRSNSTLVQKLAAGSGARFAFGDHRAMILHRLANDRVSVTLFQAQNVDSDIPNIPLKSPLRSKTVEVFDKVAQDPVRVAKTLIEEHYSDWDPQLVEVLSSIPADSSINTWNLHALPVGFRWSSVPGVTCIGDAAHVMPPFGGEGVNLALLDAWLLGRTIVRAWCDGRGGETLPSFAQNSRLHEAVREFEHEMWARATRGQILSHGLMRCMMFQKGVPRSVVARWLLLRAWYETSPKKWPLMKVVIGAVVYGFYGTVKLFR